MHRLKLVWLCVSLLVLQSISAFAVNPNEVLSNPALEERARNLSVEIRCLVCQNQSIDDSDAQLARDLRVLVREKITEGMSDDDILEFLVERYGEFVLLRPRFGGHTLLLWALPIVILLIGAFVAYRLFRKRAASPTQENLLSEEEQRHLDALIKQE